MLKNNCVLHASHYCHVIPLSIINPMWSVSCLPTCMPEHSSKRSMTRGKARAGNWTIDQDRVLLSLLREQFDKNNYILGSWKPCTWNEILPHFNVATHLDYDRDNLYNRWKTLKKNWLLYKDVCSKSGWGWDSQTNMLIPGYEGAWVELIEVILIKFSKVH